MVDPEIHFSERRTNGDRRLDRSEVTSSVVEQFREMLDTGLLKIRLDFWKGGCAVLIAMFATSAGIVYLQAKTDENQTTRIESLEKGSAAATSDRYTGADAKRDKDADKNRMDGLEARIGRNEQEIEDLQTDVRGHFKEHPPASMHGIIQNGDGLR